MTVVENMDMAREHLPPVINWKAETEQLAAFMETMPFRVDPTATVRHLAAGEKQKVEILKQLYLRRKVLILDEPTSVLTPQEADEMGVPALCGLSLDVHAHEIVGIAGVSGNGQRELVQVLAGQRAATGGQIVVHGEDYHGTREEIRRH